MFDLSKCFKYYNKLDDDCANLVLSKLRNNQKELLDDIINFKKQKKLYIINIKKMDLNILISMMMMLIFMDGLKMI